MSVQEPQAPATPEAEDKTPENPVSTEPLGDAGKRALDAERKARRDADRRAAQLEAKLKEYEDAQKSDTEKLNDKLAEATKLREETEQRLKDTEIRLAVIENAGEGDPARLLKHTDFLAAIANVDPDDTDAVAAVIAQAIKDEPWLKRAGRSAGDVSAGHAKTPPPSLSGEQLLAHGLEEAITT